MHLLYNACGWWEVVDPGDWNNMTLHHSWGGTCSETVFCGSDTAKVMCEGAHVLSLSVFLLLDLSPTLSLDLAGYLAISCQHGRCKTDWNVSKGGLTYRDIGSKVCMCTDNTSLPPFSSHFLFLPHSCICLFHDLYSDPFPLFSFYACTSVFHMEVWTSMWQIFQMPKFSKEFLNMFQIVKKLELLHFQKWLKRANNTASKKH